MRESRGFGETNVWGSAAAGHHTAARCAVLTFSFLLLLCKPQLSNYLYFGKAFYFEGIFYSTNSGLPRKCQQPKASALRQEEVRCPLQCLESHWCNQLNGHLPENVRLTSLARLSLPHDQQGLSLPRVVVGSHAKPERRNTWGVATTPKWMSVAPLRSHPTANSPLAVNTALMIPHSVPRHSFRMPPPANPKP